MMPTCEGCQRTSETMMTNELCSECSDKAARFDMVVFERNQLLTGVKRAITDLEHGSKTKDAGLRLTFLSQALGRLRVVEHYCES
jgi:hypothetical protein